MTIISSHLNCTACTAPIEHSTTVSLAAKRNGRQSPVTDVRQVVTIKISKGLEFQVVALAGMGHMPPPGEHEKEAARVFYGAATRDTQRFVMEVEVDRGGKLCGPLVT